MATQTTNYKLTKPTQDEYYNVQVFNDNADKIDAALNNKAEGTHNHDGKYYPMTGGDLKGSIGANYELRIRNNVDYSKNYFFLRNICYSNTLRNHFVLGMHNTETDDEKQLIEFYNTDAVLTFLLALVIKGKTFTPAVELYAEKSGENAADANNGGFIDFHYNQDINTNQTTSQENDYTTRIIEDAKNELDIQATAGSTNKAKLKVNGNQVYDNSRIMVRTTNNVTAGVSPLSQGNIILVIE